MEFNENKNRITIQAENMDQEHVELEELRRNKAKTEQLERKLNAVMEQLGIKNI